MSYRACLDWQPGVIGLEEPIKWEAGQVHAEFPKMNGLLAGYVNMVFISMFGNSAPNISLVLESGTGSVGKDGSPTGCYASVHNNESDMTFMPVEYPIYDYSKVNPVQVLQEGTLDIISTYRVEDKFSIIYADLLQSSLKSFDMNVWLVILMTFCVFAGLLWLRKCLRKFKKIARYQPVLLKPEMKESSYSPLFQTFVHMIGQDCNDFVDRSGNLISLIMTIGFFFILVFYLNLMSTELVVVTKPHVINNYRDIMNADMAVGFISISYDATEFEKAEEGSIQEEFWKKYSETRIMMSTQDPVEGGQLLNQVTLQKGVIIMSSIGSQVFLELCCKAADIAKSGTVLFGKSYGWSSSDPEGKQHTSGLIMRQGLITELVIKGQKRLKGLFEGSLIHQVLEDSVGSMDFSIMQRASYSNIRECMSKEVHYNQPQVEKVNVMNFKYLALICMLLFLVSFAVLVVEILLQELTK